MTDFTPNSDDFWAFFHQIPIFNVAQRILYDIRDNNKYTIRKLADGNCWMTSNLNFALEANKTYTGVNNITGEEITFSTDAACTVNDACAMNGNTMPSAGGVFPDNWYYSWYAATANSGKYSDIKTDALLSICPKNWRLPPNYSITLYKTYSYGYLTDAYGITTNGQNSRTNNVAKLESFPLSFIQSANSYNGVIGGEGGLYRASTASSDARHMYDFIFNSVTPATEPQHTRSKYYGEVIRCVAL